MRREAVWRTALTARLVTPEATRPLKRVAALLLAYRHLFGPEEGEHGIVL